MCTEFSAKREREVMTVNMVTFPTDSNGFLFHVADLTIIIRDHINQHLPVNYLLKKREKDTSGGRQLP